MNTFGLVDCNNFYASCESVFQPRLRNKPVIVLSNNDGCVIARSEKAKILGISMGVPLFEIRHLVKKHKIIMLSSNYALYGDLSNRVINILKNTVPYIEIYSIDECFLGLDELSNENLTEWCLDLRNKIYRWVGIPTSIGIGPTKTLSKIANKRAKSNLNMGSIINLSDNTTSTEEVLGQTVVSDVWGIGLRWSKMLNKNGVQTALDLKNLPDNWVRQRMGITGLKTIYELRGISCHPLEIGGKTKKTTCCSQSFGETTTSEDQAQDAIIYFAERASERIRQNQQVCKGIKVFISADVLNHKNKKITKESSIEFIVSTSDSRLIVSAAIKIFRSLCCKNLSYRKAGVLLFKLSTTKNLSQSTFLENSIPNDELMSAVDSINKKFGQRSIHLGVRNKNQKWRLRQNYLSPKFTTQWEEIPKVQIYKEKITYNK